MKDDNMKKIKLEDLKANKLNCILIPMYTAILALVYGSWIGLSKYNIPLRGMFVTIVVFAIVIAGCVFFYLSNLKVAKERIAKQNEKNNEE